MPTSITEAERRALKRLAHHLEVVVRTGNAGLTPAVINETEAALAHHELLKVRVLASDRDERDTLMQELCKTLGAALVQRVGHVATIYRPDPRNSRIKALLNPAEAAKAKAARTENRPRRSEKPKKPSPWKSKPRRRTD